MEDDQIRKMMVIAHDLKMVDGDFVFLTYNHSYFEGQFWKRVIRMKIYVGFITFER